MDPVAKLNIKHSKRDFRSRCAELCYYYPQYDLEDVEEMNFGDVQLLLNFARLRRTQDLLDYQAAVASAQDPKAYKQLRGGWEKAIKQFEAEL